MTLSSRLDATGRIQSTNRGSRNGIVTSQQETRSNDAAPGVDYYKLLNVPYTATFQEITRAYRDAMKRAHPDRARPERRAAAEERAKLLNLAFTTLSKADTRREYDATIKASAVQDQIMKSYFGGMGMPGGGATDPFGEALRRELTREERVERRRADRSATASILIVFGGLTLAALGVLLIWAILSSALRAAF